nr:MAG TPA: hypothetical protein [Caudoviricetes sp.]
MLWIAYPNFPSGGSGLNRLKNGSCDFHKSH